MNLSHTTLVLVRSRSLDVGGCTVTGRRWSLNPSGKCSYERPTRGTVRGTMRSICGCLAINYQSLYTVTGRVCFNERLALYFLLLLYYSRPRDE